ncbi:transposase [Cereibacter azotoformans]|uniref:transposase n=1 Tax=Cereibacter azotoformans TaxID=43057 RepID=UPI000E35E1F3|nr:transposase [Cereibacter azotoformans]AXQ95531.1 transposase [Cereibacter sphaeroides]UIJ32224.1 transposase [Cereibacter azotoformans]
MGSCTCADWFRPGNSLEPRGLERDDEIARLKAKVGEITMANELLYAGIDKLEAGSPLAERRLRGRSRKRIIRSSGSNGECQQVVLARLRFAQDGQYRLSRPCRRRPMQHATPASLFDALLKSIADLPPAQIMKAEAALSTARRRAEAIVEIDAVGAERPCPHCGGHSPWSSGCCRRHRPAGGDPRGDRGLALRW